MLKVFNDFIIISFVGLHCNEQPICVHIIYTTPPSLGCVAKYQ